MPMTACKDSQTTPVQITHDCMVCCFTCQICVEQNHTKKTCIIYTGVISPAAIALSMLCVTCYMAVYY